MKKTMKRSLLLVIVIALFAAITLTASAIDNQPIFTPIDEPMCTAKGGHIQSKVASLKPATVTADGKYGYFCVNCDMPMDCENIPKIDTNTLKLSASKYVYDGKTKKPTLNKIKDIDGKVLVKNKDYKVSYQSGRTNPGKYTVKITFMGNYGGTTKLAFSILPQTVSGLKSTAQTTSAITLSWSKVTGATGYQVYKYNASTKKYENIQTLTANSYKATSLKDNTTFKFKVRAYTKAADGTIVYGGYSSVCSAKTKIEYGVKFAENSGTIYVGATTQIKATTTPANKALTWKSSNASVAKVSSTGKVTAVKNGTATITASLEYNGKTYKRTYKVTVKKPSIELGETYARITEGKTLQLTATADPADLTITWKSSNTFVATVSSTGVVEAKNIGTATITASITYKGTTYKKICNVEIEPVKVGNITGNVTYYYNDYRGNVPDTGAMVILIPKDGSARGLENEFMFDWFYDPPRGTWNEEYGIYGAEVDGTGHYYLSYVPVGEYLLFVISEETTAYDGYWNREKYKASIKGDVQLYLSATSAKSLAEAVSNNKYECKTVTVRDNYTTHASVDFGITYY